MLLSIFIAVFKFKGFAFFINILFIFIINTWNLIPCILNMFIPPSMFLFTILSTIPFLPNLLEVIYLFNCLFPH